MGGIGIYSRQGVVLIAGEGMWWYTQQVGEWYIEQVRGWWATPVSSCHRNLS